MKQVVDAYFTTSVATVAPTMTHVAEPSDARRARELASEPTWHVRVGSVIVRGCQGTLHKVPVLPLGRFVEGEDRRQSLLLPELLDDYVSENNPVRVVEVFIDELDLVALGSKGVQSAATGRSAYHPSTLLKIYFYGYLNRLQSSRRLEREAQRNIELMWFDGGRCYGENGDRLEVRRQAFSKPMLFWHPLDVIRVGAGSSWITYNLNAKMMMLGDMMETCMQP